MLLRMVAEGSFGGCVSCYGLVGVLRGQVSLPFVWRRCLGMGGWVGRGRGRMGGQRERARGGVRL